MKLSIIIPCFNESATLALLLDKVLAASTPRFDKQVVIVDDGSTDQSPAIAQKYVIEHPGVIISIQLPRNRGKGAAVAEGFKRADGDILLVQDADLEYDPSDYAVLLAPFDGPDVQVVYGSRILGSSNRSYHRYYWGGRLLTWFTNLVYGSHLTDEPTGYKLFRRQAVDGVSLRARGFEFCPEITAKMLRRGFQIHEVPIHYFPRSFQEGKKIRWTDGLVAVWTLLRLRFARKS